MMCLMCNMCVYKIYLDLHIYHVSSAFLDRFVKFICITQTKNIVCKQNIQDYNRGWNKDYLYSSRNKLVYVKLVSHYVIYSYGEFHSLENMSSVKIERCILSLQVLGLEFGIFMLRSLHCHL
jgi:hypothetical protein